MPALLDILVQFGRVYEVQRSGIYLKRLLRQTLEGSVTECMNFYTGNRLRLVCRMTSYVYQLLL